MSALCQKRTLTSLFNHLARFGKQCWRYRQPEGLGGLEIDHEIELAWLQLSATAIGQFDGQTFAQALERCIERSKGPPLLNGPVEPLPC